jgi:hypothetical protein
MKLNHGLHLAYCTNIHRGETWAETFDALKRYTLAVRDRVCPSQPYAIGLRLSHRAATELNDRPALVTFQRWLADNHCYVFTINGFPFGRFHGGRVKEYVYLPDWTSSERLAYTNLLFDLLAQLLPAGVEGSVSTVPGGFKELIREPSELAQIRNNIWHCVEHIARVSAQTGRALHLGLEPEPLCLLECSGEVIHFFDRIRAEHKNDPRLNQYLGVNYDTCHFAVEYEEPQNAIATLRQHQIKISKFHLSSALRVVPTAATRAALGAFTEDTYLHQVVVRRADGSRVIYRDLPDALSAEPVISNEATDSSTPHSALRTPHLDEWRIHFHIPLHCPPTSAFDTTAGHILGVLDLLQVEPTLCSHLEMETYTWEVLPPDLKSQSVVEQLAGEYDWTLARLRERGLV